MSNHNLYGSPSACMALSSGSDRGCAKILIVDDSEIDRMLLRRFLEMSGPEITVDEGGTILEACNVIQQNRYDCIILDYNIGFRTGREILNFIKENDRCDGTVVYFVSGATEEGLAQSLIAEGAQGFFRKEDLSIELARTMLRDVLHQEW